MELDDILDSDAESPGAGGPLSKFSFLAKLSQIFFNYFFLLFCLFGVRSQRWLDGIR